jgi:putative flippase GtrA
LLLLVFMLPQFFRFCSTGAIGFIVDSGILLIMTKINHLPPIPSRSLSFTVAVVVTWALNRSWTFRVSSRPSYREFLSYLTTQAVGLGSNFAMYSFLIILQLPVAGGPIAALGVASLCALGINYAGMRVIVFSRSNPTSSAKIISKRDAADNDRRDKDGQEENARHR